MTIMSNTKVRILIALTGLLLLAACGGKRGFETIDFKHQIDPRHVAVSENGPQISPEFNLSKWFGLTPLMGHIPILSVNGHIDEIVVESTTTSVRIVWTLPNVLDSLFLRISDNNFATDSCPMSGIPADIGIPQLNTLDGFAHPLRLIHRGSWTRLDATMPALGVGNRYYLQGCSLDPDTGLFTGDATNTVIVDIASVLPDLAIQEIRTLGRSPDALGRLFIRVADLRAGQDTDLRGDSFNYQVTITGSSSDTVITHNGTVSLLPSGETWIIPGAETPTTSDDLRIPDDGLFYNVRVEINTSTVGLSFPEARYGNNLFIERLRARPKPLVLGIDQLRVVENCDQISDGDWLQLLTIEHHREPRRLQAPITNDIPDNSTFNLKQGFLLLGSDLNTPVDVSLGFVDCDLDVVSGFLVPGAGLGLSIGSLIVSCGGEEAYEVGGENDLVGWASATLGGVTMAAMSVASATATEEDCGPAPFSVDFQLMTQEQAEADGYDPTRFIRIR